MTPTQITELRNKFEKEYYEDLEKLPFEKHVDDGQFNDGQQGGFKLGAEFAFNWFIENIPKDEVKDEPVGYLIDGSQFVLICDYQEFKSYYYLKDAHFAPVYTHPVKEEDKWINVKDRSIPRDGKEYVTINGNQGFVRQFISWDIIHSRFVNKGQYVFEGNAGTHWMPLPEQPKI